MRVRKEIEELIKNGIILVAFVIMGTIHFKSDWKIGLIILLYSLLLPTLSVWIKHPRLLRREMVLLTGLLFAASATVIFLFYGTGFVMYAYSRTFFILLLVFLALRIFSKKQQTQSTMNLERTIGVQIIKFALNMISSVCMCMDVMIRLI